MPTTRPAAEKLTVADQSTHKRLYLTPEEAGRLIAACGKHGRYPFRNRVMVRMIYRHGLRVSEACDLRWPDIDLSRGTVHVIRKKMGKDSTHTMDRDEIGDLRKLAKATNSPFVFVTERGGPMSRAAVQRIISRAGETCGMPDAHPHMLRHAAGYMLTNSDVDMRLIQDFLGHKTASMTMHYCAISPKRLAALRVR